MARVARGGQQPRGLRERRDRQAVPARQHLVVARGLGPRRPSLEECGPRVRQPLGDHRGLDPEQPGERGVVADA